MNDPDMTDPDAANFKRDAFVLCAFVFGIVATEFYHLVKELGARHYDPKTPEGLVLSRRLAYEATPLLDAITAFRSAHRKVPSVEELKGSSLLSPAYKSIYFDDRYHWYYLPESDSRQFRIRIKLGWDPDLWYDSSSNEWEYDPGDGTESTVFAI